MPKRELLIDGFEQSGLLSLDDLEAYALGSGLITSK